MIWLYLKNHPVFQRVLTAVLFLLIFLFCWFLFPKLSMPALVSIITLLLLWEYYNLILPFFLKKIILSFTFFSFVFYPLFFFLIPLKINWLSVCLYIFFLFVFWISYWKKLKNPVEVITLSFFSLFYICFNASLFLKIFMENSVKILLLWSLALVLTGDISAYFAGKFLGKKKWVPWLSPGKTWLGLFAGLFAGGFIGILFSLFVLNQKSFNFVLLGFSLGVFLFFTAQTGDLFLSLLKRKKGVKNTGRLLPGHGGLLDRLDGFLLAFPLMYVFWLLFFSELVIVSIA